MIDWHSHILPAMDDGSRSTEESIQMLKALWEQGIDRVIATPHFLANRESVADFLQRREKAYDRLCQASPENLPQVICGAEVAYYPGIGRLEGFEQLTIGNSKLLLLEMPVAKWTEYTVRELGELSGTSGLTIVLAHIERYLGLQNRDVIDRLCENGLLMQVNASFFNTLGTRHKAFKLLQVGNIHFIGSDCHNMETRPPRIGCAYGWIEKKFGKEYLSQMHEYNCHMLEHK
jgi:protein-tyrosine phosphatase